MSTINEKRKESKTLVLILLSQYSVSVLKCLIHTQMRYIMYRTSKRGIGEKRKFDVVILFVVLLYLQKYEQKRNETTQH